MSEHEFSIGEFKQGEILNYRFTPKSTPWLVEFLHMSASGKRAYIKHIENRYRYTAYVKISSLERRNPTK